jgi:glycosyltransferase involved in cell wall biosynthesis
VSFLYVGRLAPEKNLPLIINAFAGLATTYSDAKLTLLGDGPLKHDLQTLISTLQLQGRITIKSWTEDVATEMSRHDVLCHSSHHEGWGMVLVEAAAAGLPVITTDVGCAGECVRSGETGQVMLVGDTQHYQQAMELYLRDPSLIAAEGTRGHTLVKEIMPNEATYIQHLVESYTSCGA